MGRILIILTLILSAPAPTVPPTKVVSTFQTNSVAMRKVSPRLFPVRHRTRHAAEPVETGLRAVCPRPLLNQKGLTEGLTTVAVLLRQAAGSDAPSN